MSDYQFIHFVACERPLDDKALEYMEKQSTRAEISRWEFTNEYHFGDFRGNAVEMLRRGYDAHLHFANFGIRKLMFRLPELPCDKKTFAAFQPDFGLAWTKDKRGRAGILTIEPETEPDTFDYLDNVDSMLPRIAPLREMLMNGNLCPLYLAWLACDDGHEMPEPPVPAGLGQLDAALAALAEFYELSPDLLAAAAQQAPASPEKPDRDTTVDQWTRKLTKAELKQVVSDLLTGDPAVAKADLLNRIRPSTSVAGWPTAESSRTMGRLQEIAESVRTERVKREALASERARKRHLKSIAADPKKTIRQIDALVADRSTRSYHLAADCLTDLAEALGEGQGPKQARQIATRLRTRKPRYNVLIGILRKRGWIE